jgi:ankyrin repeat protein
MEACQLGDLSNSDPEIETVSKFLTKDPKINVRIEDEKGEMPLHKLARVKVDDKNRMEFKRIFNELVGLMRTQAKEKSRGLAPDINHQDKAGKTPLFMAVEHKNVRMMELLYLLDKDGPDSLLVNSFGWTVLHAAVNTDDLDVLKALVKHFTPARIKLLLTTPDKTGREPLHIAAYKCTEELVTYLIELGASNKKADSAGNTPGKLADRSGRRRSKDIIDHGPVPAAAAAAGAATAADGKKDAEAKKDAKPEAKPEAKADAKPDAAKASS